MTPTEQRAVVAEGLFTWPSDHPQLIGSRGPNGVSFPARADEERVLLSPTGALWGFTTQQYRPPSPPYDGHDDAGTFVPYGIGYVELPGELLVQTRITETDPDRLQIGQEMELRIVPYTTRPDGTQVLTYAFAPAGDQS